MKIEFATTSIVRSGDRRCGEPLREIAYLRISHTGMNFGYAELAPLASWGHPTLAQLFASIDSGVFHPLLQRTIVLANQDLVAREARLSLLLGSQCIENHLLYQFTEMLPEHRIERIKVKLGSDLEAETQQLKQLLAERETLKVRIDFNGYFNSAAAFLKWWQAVSFKSKIEFIEDPVLDDGQWREIEKHAPEVTLAADQMLGRVAAGVVVLKPSWDDVNALLLPYDKQNVAVVCTHVLGTALDQAQSLAEALKIKSAGWNLLPCGLVSLHSEFNQDNGRISVSQDVLGYGVTIRGQGYQWRTI